MEEVANHLGRTGWKIEERTSADSRSVFMYATRGNRRALIGSTWVTFYRVVVGGGAMMDEMSVKCDDREGVKKAAASPWWEKTEVLK